MTALLFFFIVSLLIYRYSSKTDSVEPLQVQFAYAVTSINPAIYDDWESGFIGNHIYYRLLPEEDKPWIPYVTKNVSIKCRDPRSATLNDACKVIRISFKAKQFVDCLNRVYTVDDIRHEFEEILNLKRWILPKWKSCGKNDDICVEGKYIPDQLRRLHGTSFRFGWSRSQKNDGTYGSGPYCLKGNFNRNGNLTVGTLISNSKKVKLPDIKFHTSQNKDNQFNFAIYGNKGLLTKNRKNVQVHTPLAYYVITNPQLDSYYLPWNSNGSKNIIHDALTEKDVFFSETPQFVKFAPEGGALRKIRKLKYTASLEFVIPDYLPGCEKLADSLNVKWKKYGNVKARCTDIVDYVVKNVIEKRNRWDGFFVGISASDPSRESLRYQYFTPNSPSSWTYDYPYPDNLYYLVGIGQSLATVDGERICSMRPNPLGLSNIFITDLLPCNG